MDEIEQVRLRRLTELLQKLADQGYTQQSIASQTGVPAQYLSDVKTGRRALSELYARRLADEFDLDYRWLMGESPERGLPDLSGRGRSAGRSVWLPVFSDPVEGDPRAQPNWDGSSIEVCGAAATKVLLATEPYVLRFGASDHLGRLQRNDLVLISQAVSGAAKIQVLRQNRSRFLARRSAEGAWIRLATGKEVPDSAVPVGHCLGILWGLL